jgi:Na+/proline symporter
MSEYAGGESKEHAVQRVPISVPFVVLAAVLCGLGLLSMSYWLITFNWALFAGVIPLVVGAYMLFTPRAGWDHA